MHLILDVEFATLPKLYRSTRHGDIYAFNISTYIISAYPDLFSMQCVHNDNVLLNRHNITKERKLYLHVKITTEQNSIYNCTVKHVETGRIRSYILQLSNYKDNSK